jgi:hypothetical protein
MREGWKGTPVATGFAAFNCNSVANFKVESGWDISANGRDDTCSFMSEYERLPDGKVAIASMSVVMNCMIEQCGDDDHEHRLLKTCNLRSLPQSPVA